jgi:hypothetical protein
MNDLEQLFDRFERVEPSELSRADAQRLAQLIQSDSRCCAALPSSFGSRRERVRFRRALQQAWLEEEYAEVLDYRPRLLRSATQHRRRRAPLLAIVLYATWIEHTVNAIVIGAGRMSDRWTGTVDDMARNIVAADFPARLNKMWSRYQAPPLDRTVKQRLVKFMELRNELVHYKWIGVAPARLEADLSHMRTLASSAPELVGHLRRAERLVTTAKFRPRIRRLLGLESPRATAA